MKCVDMSNIWSIYSRDGHESDVAKNEGHKDHRLGSRTGSVKNLNLNLHLHHQSSNHLEKLYNQSPHSSYINKIFDDKPSAPDTLHDQSFYSQAYLDLYQCGADMEYEPLEFPCSSSLKEMSFFYSKYVKCPGHGQLFLSYESTSVSFSIVPDQIEAANNEKAIPSRSSSRAKDEAAPSILAHNSHSWSQRVCRIYLNSYCFPSVAELSSATARFILNLFYPQQDNISGPPTSLQDVFSFILKILLKSRISMKTVLLGLYYLYSIKLIYPLSVGSSFHAGHRLFLSSIIVASKFLYDDTYTNGVWALVSDGFTISEVNFSEREILSLLDYKLWPLIEETWILVIASFFSYISTERESGDLCLCGKSIFPKKLATNPQGIILNDAGSSYYCRDNSLTFINYENPSYNRVYFRNADFISINQ